MSKNVLFEIYTKEKVISNAREDLFYSNNFEEVISLFENLKSNIKIFFVAGDIGVLKQKTMTFCEKKNNLYFIATGMGNKTLDNYLKILISSDGEILSIKPFYF